MHKLFVDRSGMILVVAVPLGALLVGFLWYLAAVGDAVLFRERLQDAADSTAFESAVLHARGMNAISLINMLMALLLSVVVALRAAEIILAAGLVFFGVTAGPLADVIELDVQYAPKIGDAIGMMAKLEKGIAAATPVMATVLASGSNTVFYREKEAASGVVALSYALFPGVTDSKFKVDPSDRSQLKAGGSMSSTPRLGATLVGGNGGKAVPSLPVEEGDYDVLCAQAVLVGIKQVAELGSRFGVPGFIINKAMDKVRDLISNPVTSTLLCRSFEDSVESGVESLAMQVCGDGSDLPDDPEPPKKDDANAKPDPAAAKQVSLDKDTQKHTKSDAKSATNDCKSKLGEAGSKQQGGADDQLPARMWGPARNGNVLLQTWSVAVSGRPKYEDADERGMAIASPHDRPDLHANRLATAQAEYYYACSKDETDNPVWNNCKDHANWALGWTARMRRFWWPVRQLEQLSGAYARFEGALVAIDGLIENGLSDLRQGGKTEQAGQTADAALRTSDVFKSLTGEKGHWVH